jgi:predicted transcriptional regulator
MDNALHDAPRRKGAKAMAKASIQIRIDQDLLEWVDEKAAENDRSRSWIVNDSLRLLREQALGRQRHEGAS